MMGFGRECWCCQELMYQYRRGNYLFYTCEKCKVTKRYFEPIEVAPPIATETSHPGIVPAEIGELE